MPDIDTQDFFFDPLLVLFLDCEDTLVFFTDIELGVTRM